MNFNKRNILFLMLITALTVIIKIVCAPVIDMSGFSPVIAISLFSGFMMQDRRQAVLIPLVCLFVSDIIIQILYVFNLFQFAGLYKWQILNYALFIIITFLGIALKSMRTAGLVISAFLGPVVFFLASNFFVWFLNGEGMGYSKDFAGLIQSYTFGLPFFRNSLLATIIFLPLAILLHNGIIKKRFTIQLSTVTANEKPTINR